MKYLLIILLLFSCQIVMSQPDEQKKSLAEEFLNHLKSKDFDKAYTFFDSSITTQFSKPQLISVWEQLTKQYGEFNSLGKPASSQITAAVLFVYPVYFKNGALDAKIAVNYMNKISGFFLSVRPEEFTYLIPKYADTTKFTETDFTFGDPYYELKATLTIPKNIDNCPVVVLVHGSGPHDKDVSIGPNKVFKDIAFGLASNGVAVMRYDKRTKIYPNRLPADKVTLNTEVIDDVVYAVRYLEEYANKYKIDKQRIFVLGHSLGGGLLPRIDKQTSIPKAFISLAGMTRTIDVALIEQTTYLYNLDGVFSEDEKREFDTLKTQIMNMLSPDLNENTPPESLPFGVHPNYWLDFRSLNPATEAKSLNKPILVLQGEKDYQVTMADFEGWKNALSNNKKAEFISYPNLNHLFMLSGEKSNPQE